MNMLLAIMLALWVRPTNTYEMDRYSCPFDSSAQWQGFQSRNICYTLISDYDGHGSHDPLQRVCTDGFKNGTLYYFGNVSNLPVLKWQPKTPDLNTILSSPLTTRWNAYICRHWPYKNCVSALTRSCEYDPTNNQCLLKTRNQILQHKEMPFGRSCQDNMEWSTVDGLCDCANCETTEWSDWTVYMDVNNNIVSTRYRPPSLKPDWKCNYDSAPCCHQVQVGNIVLQDNEQPVEYVQCNRNASKKERDAVLVCDCPSGTTGLFCEISHSACEKSKCENNGTCLDGRSQHACKCQHPYTGPYCNETETSYEDLHVQEQRTILEFLEYHSAVFISVFLFLMLAIMAIVNSLLKRNTKANGMDHHNANPSSVRSGKQPTRSESSCETLGQRISQPALPRDETTSSLEDTTTSSSNARPDTAEEEEDQPQRKLTTTTALSLEQLDSDYASSI